MDLIQSEHDGVVVLTLKGKMMGMPEESSLTDLIYGLADDKKTKVVLDLSLLTWMNSRALGMCISGLTTLRNRGGDLRMANVSKPVDVLLHKCHLHTVFQSYTSVEDAVASFK